MQSGQLQQDSGILGNRTAASKFLEGTYVSPEGSRERVVGMLQMIGDVVVSFKDTVVDIVITIQDYIKYWKGFIDKTLSSVYGLRFFHCKNAASSN